jgi:hypothetical protein
MYRFTVKKTPASVAGLANRETTRVTRADATRAAVLSVRSRLPQCSASPGLTTKRPFIRQAHSCRLSSKVEAPEKRYERAATSFHIASRLHPRSGAHDVPFVCDLIAPRSTNEVRLQELSPNQRLRVLYLSMAEKHELVEEGLVRSR